MMTECIKLDYSSLTNIHRSELYPRESGKLTGMLLELDKAQLVELINNPKELEEASKEAMVALQQHNTSSTS